MKKILYSQAVREALAEEMRRNPSLFIMGEDVETMGGVFACTRGLLDEFGHDRIRNTPISEAAIVGAGVGAAMTGTPMCVEIQYVDFIFHAMDQVVNQAAKLHYMSGGKVHVPLTIRTQQGIGRGNGAQHSQCLEELFCHMPGLKIALPSSAHDVKGLLKTALRGSDPVIVFEHKMLYGQRSDVPEDDYTIPFGEANIVRPGDSVTIVATSWMVSKALEAADVLAARDIRAEVIDPRTLVPLDMDTILRSIQKTGRGVIVHESHATCGIGAEIGFQIQEQAFKWLDAPILRVAGVQTPIPYSRALEPLAVPSVEKIVQTALKVCYAS
jgi:acetoin:2,6-dichlorophenolindophenol oxidoreductase subunit beta